MVKAATLSASLCAKVSTWGGVVRHAPARQSEDAVIARCQTWIADNYRGAAPVAAMVRLSGLAERSFKRRFQQATGMSPLVYVHTLRLLAPWPPARDETPIALGRNTIAERASQLHLVGIKASAFKRPVSSSSLAPG